MQSTYFVNILSSIQYLMSWAIWYQTLKNGVQMVGPNAVITSYNAFQWLSQESVSLNPFAWHLNSYLIFNRKASKWHKQ